MLTDEVIDEDIEALLYAQVYYGKSDTTVLSSEIQQLDSNISKENSVEAVDSECHEINKLANIDHSYDSNIRLEEQQNSDEDKVNLEPPIDDSSSPISAGNNKPGLDPKGIAATSEKPDSLNQISRSLDPEHTDVPQQHYIEISTSSASTDSTEKSPTQIVAQIPVLTAPSNSSNHQLLNNITINQYIYPKEEFLNRLKVYRENIGWSKQCEKDLRRLQRGKLNEKVFFSLLKRRLSIQKNKLKKQEQIRKLFFNRQQKIASSEVICLSDSDNSDVEIISVEPPSRNAKKSESVRMKPKMVTTTEPTSIGDSSDDVDEVIYVAPPPVPVINVDDESDLEDCSETPKEKSDGPKDAAQETSSEKVSHDLDEASNDFLAPTITSENFNFGLHGSEFQDAEFVRPANPTDTYETESSTSTSDFNRESSREFSNSVKTIVFNEVDFPKEDIFEGSSLEKFGELITPDRGGETSADKDEEKEFQGTSKAHKKINPRTSESSSESDYDTVETHQNLPDLSPMVNAELSRRKYPKNKTKSVPKRNEELKNKTSNKTKHSNFSTENDGILDADKSDNTVDTLEMRGPKRRSTELVLEDQVPKKKAKKKKKKSGHTTADQECSTKDSTILENAVHAGTPIGNLQSDWVVTSTPMPPNEDISELTNLQKETPRRKIKKKKKLTKDHDNMDDNSLSANASALDEDISVGTEDTNSKKSKRKKGSSKSTTQADFKEKTGEAIIGSVTRGEKDRSEKSSKKKNKKRKHKLQTTDKATPGDAEIPSNQESEVSSAIPEETPETGSSVKECSTALILENASSQRKEKRKNRSSLDKRSGSEGNAEKYKKSEIQIGERVAEETNVENSSGVGEKAVVKETHLEEDVVIIEQAVPILAIESDSEDEDIISFENLGDQLELANIMEDANIVNNETQDEFSIDYIKSKMSDDPEKWKILPTDRYNMNIGKKGPRCNKCRQFGHIAIYCPNKPDIPNCTLCGYEGHQEPRCPNRVCFTCAKPGNFSTVFCYKCANQNRGMCSLCNLPGHLAKYCPDTWRRYYLTTKEGPLKMPRRRNGILKPRSKQWCSGCAARGHLEFECDSYKWIREYPATSPFIFDYYDVYESEKRRSDFSSVDLRHKLQNLRRNDRYRDGSNQRKPVDERPESFQSEESSRLEQTHTPLESPYKYAEGSQPGGVTQSSETLTVEGSQPHSERSVVIESEPQTNADVTPLYPRVQAQKSSQLLPSIETLYFPRPQQEMSQLRGKRSRRREKLNPLSLLNRSGRSTGFTPYHSVLNPYSVLGAPSVNALPPLLDIPIQFGANTGVSAFNNGPSTSLLGAATLNLFSSVPSNVLSQQLADLMSSQGFQGSHQRCDFSQIDVFQGPQYGAQIPPNPALSFDQAPYNYMDITSLANPIQNEQYIHLQNNYTNRDFLDVPYTITREPSNELNYQNRDEQPSRPLSHNEHFKGRAGDRPISESQVELPSTTRTGDFISLTAEQQENVDTYKPMKLNNVEDLTSKKFLSFSTQDLKAFLASDIDKLDNVKNPEAKAYKKKLNNIDQLKKIEIKSSAVKKQIYFQFKHINMYLFGIMKLADGKKHLDFLRNFLYCPSKQLHGAKRTALLEAYGYIFGGEHPSFNYRKYLNVLSVGSTRSR